MSEQEAREIALSSEQYIVNEGVLYHLLDAKTTKSKRQTDDIRVCLVVPAKLRHDVLCSVHGDNYAGHFGAQRTYSTLRLKYFLRGMYVDTKAWVLSCEKCNTRKHPVRPTKAELHPLPLTFIGDRWAMDIINMVRTPRGNEYILTFTEYNTRYVEGFALQNTQASTIARILVDEICFRYSAHGCCSVT